MAHSAKTPTIEMLWDLEQIKQLKARYFRLLDKKEWDEFAKLFTADCKHYLPDSPTEPPIGHDEYIAHLRVFLKDVITTHRGYMPEITLLSETEAEGIWSMFDDLQETTKDNKAKRVKGYGHYFETYRKGDDGQWRISSKRNARQRLEQTTSGLFQ